jgi:hypothetical protein
MLFQRHHGARYQNRHAIITTRIAKSREDPLNDLKLQIWIADW